MTDHPTTPIRETVERVKAYLDNAPDSGPWPLDADLRALLSAVTALQAENAALKLERDEAQTFIKECAAEVPAVKAELLAFVAKYDAQTAELAALRAESARLREDAARLDALFQILPFSVRHVFGGDEREFREGIDAARRDLNDYAKTTKHSAEVTKRFVDAARTPTDGAG